MTFEQKQTEYVYRKTYWLLKDIVRKVDQKYLMGSKNDYLLENIKDHLSLLEREIHDLWNKKIENPNFVEIPRYGDKMAINTWLNSVERASFIDYDGHGDLATENQCSKIMICPSDITALKLKIPDWATHVIWYNR